MKTQEALAEVEKFTEKFNLVIGSIGFDEDGNLEKVYLFKSRAKARAFSYSPHTGGEASANIIPGSLIWERGKVKSYCLQMSIPN